ncbi:MAG TPA: SUMF1/EgtB/PvdO family nonheme iron enzyme [Candidatus Cloacimonadota bacterium]|nr:SUMF1/EgtB/PvdO family nonheme iron enzyme [Candidatus Cloacimonadota bacterium]
MGMKNPMVANCPKCEKKYVLICATCGLCSDCGNHENCCTDLSKNKIDQESLNIETALVEGGTFQTATVNVAEDKIPAHPVTVSSFYIGKYLVTQKEWKKIMGTNPSNFIGDKRPVEKITWYQAIEFCNKLSQKEGLTPCYTIKGIISKKYLCDFSKDGYRLPTEAEWEFAARGGNLSQGYTYSGGNNIDEVGWYTSNSGIQTKEVGTKKANELGIYDMNGNVCEWCWDPTESSLMKQFPFMANNRSSFYRVARGGCYCSVDKRCMVNSRYDYDSKDCNDMLGFRLARTV